MGIVRLQVDLAGGAYLGRASTAATSLSAPVGRIIPAYFQVDSHLATPACVAGGITFLGEPFRLELALSARTLQGAVIQNYGGAFNKLGAIAANALRAVDGATSLTGRVTASGTELWANGRLSADLAVTLARSTAPEAPLIAAQIGVKPVDGDGVGLATPSLDLDSTASGGSPDAKAVGALNFAWGRLRIDSAHGPETADLPVVMQTEQWNGAAFELATWDRCTTLDWAAVTYPNGTLATPANRQVVLSSGATTGVYDFADATSIRFNGGLGGHRFTAPGTGNTGGFDVAVDLSARTWLQFDWNGDGAHSDNPPNPHYNFGQYRGHDRILFWQEVLR